MTPGQQLDSSAIGQLHQGQTQEEVRQIFGKPKEYTTGANGNKLDVFQVVFSRKMSDGVGKIEIRSVHILYNAQGQVDKFFPHVGEMKGYIRRNQKWNAGHPFSTEKLNSVQRRLTTHDELIEMFGPAVIEGLDVQGNRGARWYFMEGEAQKEVRRRELSVLFDDNLVVRDFLLRDLHK